MNPFRTSIAGWLLLLSGVPLLLGGAAEAAAVLDRVKAAGSLGCGVLTEPADYGKSDIHGPLLAFDADICRAVAASVLRDPGKVTFTHLSDESHGFDALERGTIDMLLGVTPTISGASRGIRFGPTLFLDGEGLLVSRDSRIGSLADLAGKQVCFIAGTEAEAVLLAETTRRKIRVIPFPFEEEGEMQAALLVAHCDAVIDSISRLAVARAGFHAQRADFAILRDVLSIEPMAPALAGDDPQWSAVVEAAVSALFLAESAGVTRETAPGLRTTEDPILRSLGGLIPGVPESAIDRDWAVRAIGAAGNYAEIFDRDLGSRSTLGLVRGPNELWTAGGLMLPRQPR